MDNIIIFAFFTNTSSLVQGCYLLEEHMSDLIRKRCEVCRVGTPTLGAKEVLEYLKQVPKWRLGVDCLKFEMDFKNFKEAFAFFGKVAEIAEAEDHHPDMSILRWRHVELSLSTHAARGLTLNDFIVAAKIEAIVP